MIRAEEPRVLHDSSEIAMVLDALAQSHGMATIYPEPQPGAYRVSIVAVDSAANALEFIVAGDARRYATAPRPRLLIWQSSAVDALIEFQTAVPLEWGSMSVDPIRIAFPRSLTRLSRRTTLRAPIATVRPMTCLIDFTRPSLAPGKAAVIDLSEGGIALHVGGSLAEQITRVDTIRVTLDLPRVGEIRCHAKVRYVSPAPTEQNDGYRVGLEFTRVSAPDLVLLRRFVSASDGRAAHPSEFVLPAR